MVALSCSLLTVNSFLHYDVEACEFVNSTSLRRIRVKPFWAVAGVAARNICIQVNGNESKKNIACIQFGHTVFRLLVELFVLCTGKICRDAFPGQINAKGLR